MVSNMNDNRLALVQIILHVVIPGYNWAWILSYWARVRSWAIAKFQFTSHTQFTSYTLLLCFPYSSFMLPILFFYASHTLLILFPYTSCTLPLLFRYCMQYMVNYDCLHHIDLIKICMNSCTEYFCKGFLWGYTFKLHKIYLKQESIPVGCVQPACQLYMFWWLPLGVTSGGSTNPWDTHPKYYHQSTHPLNTRPLRTHPLPEYSPPKYSW